MRLELNMEQALLILKVPRYRAKWFIIESGQSNFVPQNSSRVNNSYFIIFCYNFMIFLPLTDMDAGGAVLTTICIIFFLITLAMFVEEVVFIARNFKLWHRRRKVILLLSVYPVSWKEYVAVSIDICP